MEIREEMIISTYECGLCYAKLISFSFLPSFYMGQVDKGSAAWMHECIFSKHFRGSHQRTNIRQQQLQTHHGSGGKVYKRKVCVDANHGQNARSKTKTTGEAEKQPTTRSKRDEIQIKIRKGKKIISP